MSITTQLLSGSGYIMYNKSLAKILGVNEAILVGEFCAKYEYWFEKGDLVANDGWFFITRDDIQDDTGLTDNQQRSALQTLKDNAVIEAQRKGIPAKMWYRLNVSALDDLLSKKWTSGSLKSTQQVDGKADDINRSTKKETKKETNTLYNKKLQNVFSAYADGDIEMESALIDFEKMRKLQKSPMTERAKTLLVGRLDALSANAHNQRAYKLACLDTAILNNWKSVYAPKEFDDSAPPELSHDPSEQLPPPAWVSKENPTIEDILGVDFG